MTRGDRVCYAFGDTALPPALGVVRTVTHLVGVGLLVAVRWDHKAVAQVLAGSDVQVVPKAELELWALDPYWYRLPYWLRLWVSANPIERIVIMWMLDQRRAR